MIHSTMRRKSAWFDHHGTVGGAINGQLGIYVCLVDTPASWSFSDLAPIRTAVFRLYSLVQGRPGAAQELFEKLHHRMRNSRRWTLTQLHASTVDGAVVTEEVYRCMFSEFFDILKLFLYDYVSLITGSCNYDFEFLASTML